MVSRVSKVEEVYVHFTQTDGDTPPVAVIIAEGLVPTTGWTDSELGVWYYITQPHDGILSLDFLAQPPEKGATVLANKEKPVPITSSPLIIELPAWAKGIRVHAAENTIEKVFDSANDSIHLANVNSGGVDIFPWSVIKFGGPDLFPFQANNSLVNLLDVGRVIGGPLRTYNTGDAITRDLRKNRLNVELDKEDGNIVGVWIG